VSHTSGSDHLPALLVTNTFILNNTISLPLLNIDAVGGVAVGPTISAIFVSLNP
jgi:hypothetical protein